MRKLFYFFMVCTSVPLMLLACKNEVPGSNLTNEYEQAYKKKWDPYIQVLVDKYQKECPGSTMTDDIKANIYIVVKGKHGSPIGRITLEKFKQELDSMKVNCEHFFLPEEQNRIEIEEHERK